MIHDLILSPLHVKCSSVGFVRVKHTSRLCSQFLTSFNFLLSSAVSLVISGKTDSLQPLHVISALFLYSSLAEAKTHPRKLKNHMTIGLGGWTSSGVGIAATMYLLQLCTIQMDPQGFRNNLPQTFWWFSVLNLLPQADELQVLAPVSISSIFNGLMLFLKLFIHCLVKFVVLV